MRKAIVWSSFPPMMQNSLTRVPGFWFLETGHPVPLRHDLFTTLREAVLSPRSHLRVKLAQRPSPVIGASGDPASILASHAAAKK